MDRTVRPADIAQLRAVLHAYVDEMNEYQLKLFLSFLQTLFMD